MSKKTNIKSNERLDLVDFDRAASGYTDDSLNLRAKKILLDEQSRLLSGFRIQLDSSPGQITVFNGAALDRSGQLLNEESAPEESITTTLTGASSTFYLEVEFLESESDSDSRMFWDPTFDNGGAPTPDGKEFALTIPTRKTTTWRIVQPISTTGFAVTSNPDSTKIPLAVLSTDASNVISVAANAGLATENGSSVLIEDVAIGAGSIHVQDAVHLAAVGSDVVLDYGGASPETVTVSSVDRVNGLIGFAPITASAHSVGAIVRNVTAGTLVVQQEDPSNTAAHPDKANRFFQGNEKAAIALVQSKSSFGSRNDLNIKSEKDYKDAIAGLIQEMKFGNMDPGVTSTAPPGSFSTRPRYFESAGSITGARTATVTIGDGVNTFGDFNGSDETPFTDALSALSASGGGTIYVKEGTYTFANTVTPTVPITIIGESKDRVSIVNDAATYAISAASNSILRLSNLSFSAGAGGTTLLQVDFSHTVYMDNVTMGGKTELGIFANLYADDCSFAAVTTSTINYVSTSALSHCLRCSFSAVSPYNILVGHVTGTFIDCSWSSGLHGIAIGSSDSSNVTVIGGSFSTSSAALSVSGALTASIRDCSFSSSLLAPSDSCILGVGGASPSVSCSLSGCKASSSFSGTAAITPGSFINFVSTSSTPSTLDIVDCEFTSSSAAEYSCVVFSDTTQPWTIRSDNSKTVGLTNVLSSNNTNSSTTVTVSGLLFDGNSVALDQILFDVFGTSALLLEVKNTKVLDSSMTGAGDKLFTSVTSSGACNTTITDCRFVPGTSGGYKYFVKKASPGTLEVHNNYVKLSDPSLFGVVDSLSSTVNCTNNTFDSWSATTTLKIFSLTSNTSSAAVTNNRITSCVNTGITTLAVDAECRYLLVSDNIITDFDGDATTSNAVIYAHLLSNASCTISNNILDLSTPTGSFKAGLYQDIYVSAENSAKSVDVVGNTIRGGSNTRSNIFVLTGNSGAISIENNNVTSGSAYTKSIYTIAGDTESIVIAGNTVSESTKLPASSSIYVLGTAGTTTNVAISNNAIRGLQDAVARTGYGIYASNITTLACTGNTIDRDAITTSATGISMSNVECATITGNAVNPATASSIVVDTATSDKFIITGNIVSVSGTDGTITPAGTAVGYLVENNL